MITLTYGGVLGIVYIYLSWNVAMGRKRAGAGLGHGGDEALQRDIRIHGNFAEYVPFALLLIGMLEAAHGPALLIRWLGGMLVVARLLHIWGLRQSAGTSFGRVSGAILTWLTILVASGMGLYIGLA